LGEKEAKIAAKHLKITELQGKLAASQLALLAAYSMPQDTAAEKAKRKSAIQAALAAIKKWQKKVDAAINKLGNLEEAASALEDQINAIDPDCLGDSGGDGGDQGAQGNVTVPLLLQEALMQGAPGFDRPDAVATFGIPFADSDEVPDLAGVPALGMN